MPRVSQISTAVSALAEGNTRVTSNLGFALRATAVNSSTVIRWPASATVLGGSSIFASSRRNTTALPVTLTPREIQVIELVYQGKRNKEIGTSLGISEETVQVHLKNIFAKLKVSERTAAVNIALRRGIVHTK